MSIKFFGQFLLGKGIISADKLLEAVQYQESKNLRFGEYARSKGYLSREEVDQILAEQRRTDMQFGEVAVKLRILTREQIDEILTLQRNDHIMIGEALVHKGFLSRDLLDSELVLFRKDQSQFVTEDLNVPDGVKNPWIVRDMADLTQKMMRRVANITTKVEDCYLSDSEPSQNFAAVLIRFSGSVFYEYVLSVPKDVSVHIASGVIGSDAQTEGDEIIVDAVKEFSNIVCGNIMSKLAQKGKTVELGAPEEIVSSGDGYHVVKGRTAVYYDLVSVTGKMTLVLIEY